MLGLEESQCIELVAFHFVLVFCTVGLFLEGFFQRLLIFPIWLLSLFGFFGLSENRWVIFQLSNYFINLSQFLVETFSVQLQHIAENVIFDAVDLKFNIIRKKSGSNSIYIGYHVLTKRVELVMNKFQELFLLLLDKQGQIYLWFRQSFLYVILSSLIICVVFAIVQLIDKLSTGI